MFDMNAILDAIEILVDKKIEMANYSATTLGKIISCKDSTQGKYLVSQGDAQYEAYSIITDTIYDNDESVYILYSKNDAEAKRYIVGTAKVVEDTVLQYLPQTGALSYIPESQNFAKESWNAIIELTSESENPTTIYAHSSEEPTENIDDIFLKYSNYLYCEADFYPENLSLNNRNGNINYGLKFEIGLKNNEFKTIIFDTNSMIGSLYKTVSPITQRAGFYIGDLAENYKYINKIDFFVDGYTQDEGAKISVSNIKLYSAIKNLDSLVNNYTLEITSSSTDPYFGEDHVDNIELKSKLYFNDKEISFDEIKYSWFKRGYGEDFFCDELGDGWKKLDTIGKTLTIKRGDLIQYNNTFKCIATYGILTIYSNEFEINDYTKEKFVLTLNSKTIEETPIDSLVLTTKGLNIGAVLIKPEGVEGTPKYQWYIIKSDGDILFNKEQNFILNQDSVLKFFSDGVENFSLKCVGCIEKNGVQYPVISSVLDFIYLPETKKDTIVSLYTGKLTTSVPPAIEIGADSAYCYLSLEEASKGDGGGYIYSISRTEIRDIANETLAGYSSLYGQEAKGGEKYCTINNIEVKDGSIQEIICNIASAGYTYEENDYYYNQAAMGVQNPTDWSEPVCVWINGATEGAEQLNTFNSLTNNGKDQGIYYQEDGNYLPTKDRTKQSGKTYYTYNLEEDEYEEFTGDEFEIGITYFEKNTDTKLFINADLVKSKTLIVDDKFRASVYDKVVTIGGWNVDNNSLYSGNENGYIRLQSKKLDSAIDTEFKSIYLGNEEPELAPFSITNTGKLKATSAEIEGKVTITGGSLEVKSGNDSLFLANVDEHEVYIGGFTVDNNSLHIGNILGTDMILLSTGSTSVADIAGSGAKSGWYLAAKNTFGVNKDGSLYATQGKIGGFTITNNTIETRQTGKSIELNSTLVTLKLNSSEQSTHIYSDGIAIQQGDWSEYGNKYQAVLKSNSLSFGVSRSPGAGLNLEYDNNTDKIKLSTPSVELVTSLNFTGTNRVSYNNQPYLCYSGGGYYYKVFCGDIDNIPTRSSISVNYPSGWTTVKTVMCTLKNSSSGEGNERTYPVMTTINDTARTVKFYNCDGSNIASYRYLLIGY